MKADLIIPVWFLAPWLILAAKIIRVSAYERRLELFSGLSPFSFSEIFNRIKEHRSRDPVYNSLPANANKWLVITVSWWAVSFLGLLAFALLYAHAS